jgi:hypothetical protein
MTAFHHLVDKFAACILRSSDASFIYSAALLAGICLEEVESAYSLAFEVVSE